MIVVAVAALGWHRGGHHDVAPRHEASVSIERREAPPSPPRLEPSIQTYRVSGNVVGCERAEVTLADGSGHQWRMILDDDDTEHLDDVAPGRYAVEIGCKDGLAGASYPPVVVADRAIDGIVWRVPRGATLRGRVVSAGGVGIEADIELAIAGVDTPLRTTGWGRDHSDTAGHFTISGLPAGDYQIAISSWDGVAPAEGFRVAIGEDEIVERDFALDAAGEVVGLVIDARGKPVADLDVFVRSTTTRWVNITTTNSGGKFYVVARPAELTFLAQRWGRTSFRSDDPDVDARRDVSAGGNAVRIILPVKNATLRGRVADSHGAARAEVTVAAIAEREGRDMHEEARYADGAVTTDADGHFTIGPLPDGMYAVHAASSDGAEAFAFHVRAGSQIALQLDGR